MLAQDKWHSLLCEDGLHLSAAGEIFVFKQLMALLASSAPQTAPALMPIQKDVPTCSAMQLCVPTHIACIGDSITEMASRAGGWVQLLSDAYAQKADVCVFFVPLRHV